MQLTIGQIHDLYVGLTLLDRDETVKLSADVRLKLAIDQNLIKPFADAYERSRTRALADLNMTNRKLEAKDQRSNAELEADFADANQELRAKPQDLEGVKTLARVDLKLDENSKVGGGLLARLLPILEKIEI